MAAYDGDVLRSDDYAVTVVQDGRSHSSFVHLSEVRPDGPGTHRFPGRRVSWTGFSCTGTVEVRVRILNTDRITPADAVIYPSRFSLEASWIDATSISFRLPGPGHYVVEFGPDGYRHALLVFADPWETDRPEPEGDGVLVLDRAGPDDLKSGVAEASTVYFRSGVHDLEGEFIFPANVRRIYLEAGAFVYGAFDIRHSDVKVYGRGTLSGRRMHHRQANSFETTSDVRNVVLEGITVSDFAEFAVRILGRDCVIRWVKTVGAWMHNNDGLVAWARSTINNCFVQANDDAIKLYDSDVSVSDCVVWQMANGAVLQLGWQSLEAHHVRVRNIDVVHAEWPLDNENPNNGIICLRLPAGRGHTQSDYLFENIRVETPTIRLFDLRMRDQGEGKGGGPHRIRNFVIRNFSGRMVDSDSGNVANYIIGYDAEFGFEDVRFENLVVDGIPITGENAATDGRFLIDPGSRDQVLFIQD